MLLMGGQDTKKPREKKAEAKAEVKQQSGSLLKFLKK